MKPLSTLVLLAAALAWAPAPAADYRVETVAGGLEYPWSLAFLPDGGMLVTERAGRLRLIGPDGLREAPVEGVPDSFVSGQAGLFEVALAPDFGDTGTVFLTQAHGEAGANHLRVLRGRWDGGALRGVEAVFKTWPAKTGDAHYGGRIAFLPDGSLVIGFGDGFDYREQAQVRRSHIGKVLRIAPDGSAPADNPFKHDPDTLPEVYSLGHRNVQGVVFDADSGRLWAHEHGPRGGDELNLIEPGLNYGWPLLTGGVDYNGARITPFDDYPGMTAPLLEWTPSIAPSGMALYRGDRFPDWDGSLFVSALAAKKVVRVPIRDGRPGTPEDLFTELDVRLRDVRAGPDGAIYLLTDEADGRVLRVVPATE